MSPVSKHINQDQDAKKIAILKAFQGRCFQIDNIPDKEEVRVFLARNGIYSLEFESMLEKCIKSRYKPEFLSDAQIKEWFEFYYS